MTFEALYRANLNVLHYFICCRISNRHDAEDVLQMTAVAAFENFDALADKSRFKARILSIASHKIKDYYAKKARQLSLPLDFADLEAPARYDDRDVRLDVRMTVEALPDKEKQILYLYYFLGIPQNEIASFLQIPPGTVKSRLSAGKKHFARRYCASEREVTMKSNKNSLLQPHSKTPQPFPAIAPDCEILPSDQPVFDVICKEVPGWLITAVPGEKQCFAFYDDPDRHLSGIYTMECTGPASVHGVDCVKIEVREEEENGEINEHTLFVRLTETHCMYIADMGFKNGAFTFGSFMDEEWLKSYRIGPDNCGRCTHQHQKKNAVMHPDGSITANEKILSLEESDLIGRSTVRIKGRTFDTVIMISISDGDHLVLQHLDKDGKTVLFRRFNRNSWKQERYGKLWSEMLPDSQQIFVNNSSFTGMTAFLSGCCEGAVFAGFLLRQLSPPSSSDPPA